MQNLSDATVDAEWPKSDLEYLGHCPACDSERRTLFLEALTDRVFGVAPGHWTLWRCENCQAAYLDPRPSEASIGRAYQNYYTHKSIGRSQHRFKWSGRGLRGHLTRGYLNLHYAHQLPTSFVLCGLIGALVRTRRADMDYLIRHLPTPKAKNAPCLDVGCGNGAFLRIAKDLGYSPIGLEPDDAAAQSGRDAGFDIRNGSLPNSGLPDAYFEQITLSHVFEHFHRPRDAAKEIFGLLKPGGRVWFSQPNLGAAGLKLFGRYWRGLEPPRHLSLYDVESFMNLLKNTGFERIEQLPPAPDAEFYFRQSLAMSKGIDPQLKKTRQDGTLTGKNAAWKPIVRLKNCPLVQRA